MQCVCTAAAGSSIAVGADPFWLRGKGAPVWQEWLRSHGGGRSLPEQQCVHPSEQPAALQNPFQTQTSRIKADVT